MGGELNLRKLNIGCINHKEGYIHLDIHNHKLYRQETDDFCSLDVLADATALPFRDGVFSEIYTDHAFEHITEKGESNYHRALAEAFRVLCGEGFLDITVPNLRGICQSFIDKPELRRSLISLIYGESPEVNTLHRTGFAPETLSEDLLKAGFQTIYRVKFSDLHFIAWKEKFTMNQMTPETIKDIRLRLKLSVEDFAKKANASIVEVRRWELGSWVPEPSQLEKLHKLKKQAPVDEPVGVEEPTLAFLATHGYLAQMYGVSGEKSYEDIYVIVGKDGMKRVIDKESGEFWISGREDERESAPVVIDEEK